MDNTKIISLNVDWLKEISFSSVKSAIEYLSKFDQDYILSIDQDADIESNLQLRVLKTKEELHKEKIINLETQINCTNYNIGRSKTECAQYKNLPESAFKTFKQATLTYRESTLIELQNELKELTKND